MVREGVIERLVLLGYLRTADNVCRLAWVGQMGTRPFVNVVYITFAEDDYDEANVITVINSARTQWQTEVLDQVIDNYTFLRIEYLSLDASDEFGGIILANSGQPTAGALTGAAPSPNVATLIHKNPSGAPRGFRPGRLYLPPPIEADVTEAGGVAGAYNTALAGKLTAWHDALNDPGGPLSNRHVVPSWPGLTSPPPGPLTVVEASAVVDVDSLSVDTLVATQRRRLRP